MITFDQFIKKYTGVLVDVDGAYSGQCWDLVAAYDQEVIGVPGNVFWGLPAGPDGYAREVYQYFPDPLPKYYDKLPLSATPQKGDVVVWGAGPGDEPGHIAIFVSGNLQNFTSFDQNWPLGSAPHMQNHNANYVIGFLRPKNQEEDMVQDLAHLRSLVGAYRRREPTQQEAQSLVGAEYTGVIEALGDNRDAEVQNVARVYTIGVVADRDNWQGQIESLQSQLKATGNPEVNALGNALLKVLNALGYKKS